MTSREYKEIKLAIFEKEAAHEITEAQRDEMFTYLEAEKAETELTDEKIDKFFDELEDKYPDLGDDIDKFKKKVDKAGGDGDDGGSDDDGGEEPADDDGGEDDVKESVLELLRMFE